MPKITTIPLDRRSRWFLTKLAEKMNEGDNSTLDGLNRVGLRLAGECLKTVGAQPPHPMGRLPEVSEVPGRGTLDDDAVRLNEGDKAFLESLRGIIEGGKRATLASLNIHALLFAEDYFRYLGGIGEYPTESVFDTLMSPSLADMRSLESPEVRDTENNEGVATDAKEDNKDLVVNDKNTRQSSGSDSSETDAGSDEDSGEVPEDKSNASSEGATNRAPSVTDGRWINARYNGKCAHCGATVQKGDRVFSFNVDGEKGIYGEKCCQFTDDVSVDDGS